MSHHNPFSDHLDFLQAGHLDKSSPLNGTNAFSPVSSLNSDDERHVRRSNLERYRRARERVYSTTSSLELLHLLINEEYDLKQTRKLLNAAFDKLDSESQRSAEAESQAEDALDRFRTANEEKVTAQQESARLRGELRSCQMQLEDAQSELQWMQEVVQEVTEQRDQADAEAQKAKTMAWKLSRDRMVSQAREEGRKLGFEEGLKRGRELAVEDTSSIADSHGGTIHDREAVFQDDVPGAVMPRGRIVLDTPPRMPLSSRSDIDASNMQTPHTAQIPQVFQIPPTPPNPLSPRRDFRASPTPSNDHPRNRRSPSPIPTDTWIPTEDELKVVPPPYVLQKAASSPGSVYLTLEEPKNQPTSGTTISHPSSEERAGQSTTPNKPSLRIETSNQQPGPQTASGSLLSPRDVHSPRRGLQENDQRNGVSTPGRTVQQPLSPSTSKMKSPDRGAVFPDQTDAYARTERPVSGGPRSPFLGPKDAGLSSASNPKRGILVKKRSPSSTSIKTGSREDDGWQPPWIPSSPRENGSNKGAQVGSSSSNHRYKQDDKPQRADLLGPKTPTQSYGPVEPQAGPSTNVNPGRPKPPSIITSSPALSYFDG